MSPHRSSIEPMMLILMVLLGLPSPWPPATAAWFRPPVTHEIPTQQRLLQFENGHPVKARRRGRAELLRAALQS